MSKISDLYEELRALSPKIEPVLAVLEVAQAVTGLGGARAAEGLKILETALKSLGDGASGALTHDQVMAQLAAIRLGVAADEAGEDAELAAKFPGA